MSKKRKFEHIAHPADREVKEMHYKDMKRAVVIRGMPFQEVVSSSAPQLIEYFRKHYYDMVDPTLLDQFDDWQENEIKELSIKRHLEEAKKLAEEEGKEWNMGREKRARKKVKFEVYATSEYLRLGFIGERSDDGVVVKSKRIKGISKNPKKKREKTADGIYKGTKKAYTYQLQMEGVPKKEAIQKVLDQFPEASEKSISIWYNQSRKIDSNSCNVRHAQKTKV